MRIKRGVRKNRRHNKVLKLTKGYRGANGTLYKRSKEALLHAGQYSHAHRKHRRSQMKQKWVNVISAALYDTDLNYSQFRGKLKTAGIQLNSKMLSELAINQPDVFNKVVTSVSK